MFVCDVCIYIEYNHFSKFIIKHLQFFIKICDKIVNDKPFFNQNPELYTYSIYARKHEIHTKCYTRLIRIQIGGKGICG